MIQSLWEGLNLAKKRFSTRWLIGGFALMLTAVISTGWVEPMLSQTATLSPKEKLEQKIRERAEKDVERDSPRRSTKDIVDEGEASGVGLKAPEIRDIYDEEYDERDKAKKSDPREMVTPKNGWLVLFLGLVVLAVGACLGDWLKQTVASFFKRVDDWVYGRLAGNRWFQGVTLQRYRKALVDKHQYLRIAFRGNRPPLDMGEVYVPLKVEGADSGTKVDAYQAIAQYRRLMVKGSPGAGKSMLLRYLAFAYGEDERRLGLLDRPVLVFLELHLLSMPTQEGVIQALVDAFDRDGFPKAKRFVERSLENGSLMLLLDGLDEVDSQVRPGVVRIIRWLMDKYERCRVIITCRTQVYRDEFARETEQTLEVAEFSDQQIRQFLQAWKPEMPGDKSIEQLILTLRDRPRIMALARNPLMLTIIAHLYTEPSFVLPRSRSEFYQKSTDILLEQWQSDFNVYRAPDKRRVLQHLARSHQDYSTQQQQDRRSMDCVLVRTYIRQFLPSLNLDAETVTQPMLDEIVDRSGLFMKIDGGDRYQFAHLTIQEYFAAAALKDNPAELVGRFEQDPDSWREVVKLWCGLGGDSTEFIREIYQTEPMTSFECLAEAQEVDPAFARMLIQEFREQLAAPAQLESLTAAFGAVAADSRPRGREVFEFLAKTIDSPEAETRKAAAIALSKTNLPDAAHVLVNKYHWNEAVRSPLIEMGDLAVEGLAGIVRKRVHGTQEALGDLFIIGTPDAAMAIVPVMWNEDQELASQAAWYFAAMLHTLGVEERLQQMTLENSIEITSGSTASALSNASDWTWVWQPFELMPGRNTASLICGQAIYLLRTSKPPQNLPDVDPRLIVPLCAVGLEDEAIPRLRSWALGTGELESLLEQDLQDPNVERVIQAKITELLSHEQHRGASVSERWQQLFKSMDSAVQLDLLRRLILYRQPTKNDWRTLFQKVQYEFRTGWHYRCVLAITFMFSIASIYGMFLVFAAFSTTSSSFTLASLCLFSPTIVSIFWLALYEGIEKPLEPDIFIKFGILGLPTFWLELRQLKQNNLVWAGITPMMNSLRGKAVFFTFAVAVAVGITVGVTGAGANYAAFASAVFGTIFFTFAIAVSGAVTFTFVFVVAVFFTFAIAVSGYGAIAVSFAVSVVAGIGLRIWYGAKLKPSQKKWLKFGSSLAAPWFCWSPIVSIFGTIALHQLLEKSRFMGLFAWQQTGLLEALVFGVCVLLWRRGQHLEKVARNPFKGGVFEAALSPGKTLRYTRLS